MSTKSQRSTIHIPAPIVEALDLDKDAGESLSGRIALIVERYRQIISDHCPELSRNEWMACMDVMNGMFTGMGEPTAVKFLWASVDDACSMEGLAEKWEIDGPALVKKLRALDTAGAIAVAEIGRRFWSRASGKDADQALDLAMAIVKDPRIPLEREA
jgi:hypothetical protein